MSMQSVCSAKRHASKLDLYNFNGGSWEASCLLVMWSFQNPTIETHGGQALRLTAFIARERCQKLHLLLPPATTVIVGRNSGGTLLSHRFSTPDGHGL